MLWRVTYAQVDCPTFTCTVEVEAADEMQAAMRAGMKREETWNGWNKMFYSGRRWKYPKWNRVNMEVIDGNV